MPLHVNTGALDPQPLRLLLKKLHPDAQMPVYSTAGAANFDLHCIIEGESKTDKAGQSQAPSITVSPGNQVIVRWRIDIEVKPGWVLAI